MENWIDALERLHNLKDAGALTEAEYEAQKRRIMREKEEISASENINQNKSALNEINVNLEQLEKDTKENLNVEDDITYKALNDSNRRGYFLFGLLVATFLTILFFYKSGKLENFFDSATDLTSSIDGQIQSSWEGYEKTDPMSGSHILGAQRTYDVDAFKIEAQATCSNGKDFKYTINTFLSESGDAAPFKNEIFSGSELIPYYIYEIRLDGEKAAKIGSTSNEYSNSLQIPNQVSSLAGGVAMAASGLYSGINQKNLIRANSVLVKLYLMQGAPVIKIDQTDPVLNNVLVACGRNSDVDRTDSQINHPEPAAPEAASPAAPEAASPAAPEAASPAAPEASPEPTPQS